ncbi:MAG: tryptophan synthase subunit alpha, partial [Thermodesulfobacteriota bacterium]|nr:tryptophan synthase subunit alpha [Thermodesulfobacteriota bacterium]
EVHGQVKTIKAMTDLPVCVGFGVSTASQVRDLLCIADGVIVGSHLMDQIMRASDPVKAADTAYRALLPPG